jgi:hypothetical protein
MSSFSSADPQQHTAIGSVAELWAATLLFFCAGLTLFFLAFWFFAAWDGAWAFMDLLDLLDLLDFFGVAERRLRALGVLPVAIVAGAGVGFRLCLCERAAKGEDISPLAGEDDSGKAEVAGVFDLESEDWPAASMLSTESVEGSSPWVIAESQPKVMRASLGGKKGAAGTWSPKSVSVQGVFVLSIWLRRDPLRWDHGRASQRIDRLWVLTWADQGSVEADATLRHILCVTSISTGYRRIV